MIVYHGSNVIVAQPKLVEQNRFLDFGFGFYTTTNKSQALGFAEKVARRRKTGEPWVSVYELDESDLGDCAVLDFGGATEVWLDFVSQNRAGAYNGPKYDIIFGPVANDDVYATFALYSSGVLTKEQTLEALKIKKLYNQLVMTSDKGIAKLKFIGTIPKEKQP